MCAADAPSGVVTFLFTDIDSVRKPLATMTGVAGPSLSFSIRNDLSSPTYAEVTKGLARTRHTFSAQGKKLGGPMPSTWRLPSVWASGYLMAQDTGFPLGQTVEGVRVTLPEQVWQPTLLDDM